MEKQNGPRLTQDLSTLIASVLPITQLFFTQLPASVTNVFIARKQFTGISLITLLLSYVLIIAFQSKPWFEIVLPFQRKKAQEYDAYQDRLNKAASTLNVPENTPGSEEIKAYVDELKKSPVRPPLKLKRDNMVSVGMTVLTLSALLFISLSFAPHRAWSAIIQSISYVALVVLAVLILSIYRSTVQNNAHFQELDGLKVARAIELATQNNVFGKIPTVRVVETFDALGFPNNLNVVAEYEGTYYHVITDPEAKRLYRGRKLDQYNEDA